MIEGAQVSCWVAGVLLALVMVLAHPKPRDRLNALWLMAISILATLRELDVHERLNPEVWGSAYAVSFKLTWWTDPGVPLWLKGVWALVGLAIAALVLVPPLLVRAPVLRLLVAGDAPTYLFLAAIGFLGAGYAFDDLVGRGQFVEERYTVMAEESMEMLGAASFLASVALTLRRPLSRRVGR